MDKVSKEWFLLSGFRIWNFALIGEYFWNDGDRYEGEWKDGKEQGQGKKKSDLF